MLEISGNTYTIGRLSTFKQLHVARRMAPFLSVLTSVSRDVPGNPGVVGGIGASFAQFAGPIASVLASMSDQEVESIIGDCLNVVRRQMPGGTGWAVIWNVQAQSLQFEDIGLKEMLQLTFAVLQENIGGFLPAALGPLPGQQTDQASP
jgi:hypothetical protein